MSDPKLKWAGNSDPGLKRGRNEDAYKMLVPPGDAAQHSFGALFMIADGMGGMRGGDLASGSALDAVIRAYYGPLDGGQPVSVTPIEALRDAIDAANVHVRQQAARAGLRRIGTTLAGIVILPNRAGLLFNVGDSRVYRIRGPAIEQITTDQSLAALQPHADAAKTTLGRASTKITAYLGQPFPLEPLIEVIEIRDGDRYVLCTDGLWTLIEDDELARIVRKRSADRAVHKLIQLAHKRGAPDNVSVVVVLTEGRRRLLRALRLVIIFVVLGTLGGAAALMFL